MKNQIHFRPIRPDTHRSLKGKTVHSEKPHPSQMSHFPHPRKKTNRPPRPLPRPSARRSTFLGQMRIRQQKRRKRIFSAALAGALVLLIAVWVSRTFFTSKPEEITQIRQAINDHIIHDITISDTKGRPLTTAEKKADLKILIEAMKALPAAETPGLKNGNFDQAAKTALIQAKESENDEAFLRLVKNLLASAQRPACQVIDLATYKMERANIGSGVYREGSPYAKALINPRVQDRYERFVPLKDRAVPSVPYLKWVGNNAVIQGLPFNSSATERDREAIGKLFAQGANAERIVLDLRACKGTSISYGLEAILSNFASGSFSSTSTIFFPLGFNDYVSYLSGQEEVDHVDLEDEKEELSIQTPDSLRKLLSDMAYKKRLTCSFIGKNPKVPADKVYLMVDKTTQNAAETFADFCQSNGLGRVVGKNTYGNAWDIPPFILTLPHSGLLVQMDMTCQATLDGKSLQSETGVVPAYPLQGKDLMSAFLSWKPEEEK